MIDGKRIVSTAWLTYMDGVIPKDAGNTQLLECKRAFLGGALTVLTAVERIGEDDISEDVGVEIFEELRKDVQRLYDDMIAGRA